MKKRESTQTIKNEQTYEQTICTHSTNNFLGNYSSSQLMRSMYEAPIT